MLPPPFQNERVSMSTEIIHPNLWVNFRIGTEIVIHQSLVLGYNQPYQLSNIPRNVLIILFQFQLFDLSLSPLAEWQQKMSTDKHVEGNQFIQSVYMRRPSLSRWTGV